MKRIPPDARQLAALQTQLGMLESMLRPMLGGGAVQAPTNVVPMPQRPPATPPPQAAAMQQQMVESMLNGLDPQRAGQIRALMAVANRPNVTPQEMEAAVAPLMAQLPAQDQATVRMMMSMMQQPGQPGAAPQPQAPTPALPPATPATSAELQQALDTANARAATALEEVRRVSAELLNLKDMQNQTAAAMHQQTLVMRDLLQMLKGQTPAEASDDVEEQSEEAAV